MADRKKILLVDDTDAFLIILNNILKNDYETLIAKDGEDGLETAEFTKPDLILLDVMMPDMSGYEVMAALQENDELKNIPVILISGKDSADDEAKGLALGAVDYIKKPFEKEEVLEKVQKVLGAM